MAATIRQLAKRCGVSVATVSLVLSGKDRGRVSAARRRAVLQAARRCGYRSNLMARGLSEGRTYRIAVAVEGDLASHAIIGSFSLYERLGLLARRIREQGYAIEIVQAERRRADADLRREMSAGVVDGFVFLAWSAATVTPMLRALRRNGLPAAAVGTALGDTPFVWADVDRKGSFEEATRRLLAEGHAEILLLDTDPGGHYSAVKARAFLDVMRAETGRDASRCIHAPRSLSYEDVLSVCDKSLRAHPDARAFLLTDNFYAEAVLHGLRNAGLRPGRDCRVIGFGDDVLAERCRPRLSHYSLQAAAQVGFCLTALFERMRSPESFVPRHALLAPCYRAGGT